ISSPFWSHSSSFSFLFTMIPPPPTSTLFPYTTLFRSRRAHRQEQHVAFAQQLLRARHVQDGAAVHLAADGERNAGRDVRLDQARSEEHTSELQSRGHLVCRLLLEKKKRNKNNNKRTQI